MYNVGKIKHKRYPYSELLSKISLSQNVSLYFFCSEKSVTKCEASHFSSNNLKAGRVSLKQVVQGFLSTYRTFDLKMDVDVYLWRLSTELRNTTLPAHFDGFVVDRWRGTWRETKKSWTISATVFVGDKRLRQACQRKVLGFRICMKGSKTGILYWWKHNMGNKRIETVVISANKGQDSKRNFEMSARPGIQDLT